MSEKPLRAEEVSPDVRLTIGGVILVGNRGFIHPFSIRDLFGEEAFKEAMSRPRIVSEYDSWTEFTEEKMGN